jgi:hypothetical protein
MLIIKVMKITIINFTINWALFSEQKVRFLMGLVGNIYY